MGLDLRHWPTTAELLRKKAYEIQLEINDLFHHKKLLERAADQLDQKTLKAMRSKRKKG